MSDLLTPTPSEIFTPEKARNIRRWLSHIRKRKFVDPSSSLRPPPPPPLPFFHRPPMKGFGNFFMPSRKNRLGGYPTYPTSAGYQAGGYPPGASYVASPMTYGAPMMHGSMPAMSTAVPAQVANPAASQFPISAATQMSNPAMSSYGGIGMPQYGFSQVPGSAAGGAAAMNPTMYGGIGSAQYGFSQGQQQTGVPNQMANTAAPGGGQAEAERTTTSSSGGPGNAQQTVTSQEEEVSSSGPGGAQMGNAANPAGGPGNAQYGVPQSQQVPMPVPVPTGMPNSAMAASGASGYPQYGSYPVQPFPMGSTNLSISLPPSGGIATGYRSPTPPKTRSGSHRSRSIPPTPSQSSSPRTYHSTRSSDRDMDRDSPVPLPPDYVPTSHGADDRSRGLHLPHSSHGHHHHHGSGRHRSSSQSYSNSGYLSPPRPAYSRQRSRSVDDRDMQRSRGMSGGYYSPRGVPQQQPYPYQTGGRMTGGVSSSNSPTVVQQSGSQPVMLPIDNGRGGWMVVPPRGTGLRVVDPSQISHDGTRNQHHHNSGTHSQSHSGAHSPSFFSRLFGSGKQNGSSRAAQPQPVQYHYINSPRSKHHHRRRRDSF